MFSAPLGPEAINEQLRRILSSVDFQASARLKRLLEFLVVETLEGRGDDLKAYTIALAVFNIAKGQSPRAQNQIYEEPMSLAVNLHTAMLIGWNPSLAVLAAVDEIYQAQ